MLDILTRTTLQGKGRIFTHWARMLDLLSKQIDIRLGWFDLSDPKTSGCTRMLTNMLFEVETEYLLTKADDTERYFSSIKFIDGLSMRFDFGYRNLPLKDMFYGPSRGVVTQEVALPVKYGKFIDTPMDLDIESWADAGAEPVSVLYDPSFELVEDMRSGQLERRNQPEFCVLGINVPLLIFMWLSYVREDVYERKMNPEPFVYRHVLRPMMYQQANQWLVALIAELCDPINESVDKIVKKFSETRWMPDNTIRMACEEFRNETSRLTHGQIDAGDILHSELLLSGTLMEYINRYTYKFDVPDTRLYKAMEFIYQTPYIKTLLYMFFMDESSPKARLIKRRLRVDMRNFQRLNISTMVRDANIRKVFEDGVATINTLLNM
jgi:hypothetical protein